MATAPRWAACSLAIAAAGALAAVTFLELMPHADRRIAELLTHGPWLVAVFAIESLLTLAALSAEESRLARELRIARAGTAALRSLVSQRRRRTPLLTRLFSTGLGTAAVLVADGDPMAAREAMAGSPLMHGGRLNALRAIVAADLARATATPAALERCIAELRALPPTGNLEADRYRSHVLVRAVLERGDDETAVDLARELASSPDEEQRIGATWLRIWFELDAGDADGHVWPPLGEGQARLAALAARAHGAESLVDKIEARLLAIARPEPRG